MSDLTGLAGLGIVVLAAIFMAVFAFIHRRTPFSFRSIRAFSRVRRAVSLVVEDGTRLLFTHDPECASCTVSRDDRGRFVPAGERAALDGFPI